MKRTTFILLGMLLAVPAFAQKSYTLNSPDGRIQSVVSVGEKLSYSISIDGKTVVADSPLSMTLQDGRIWGPSAKVVKAVRAETDANVPMLFYRAVEARDNYRALTLKMKGDWSVEFRAYDDGVAYRFATTSRKPFIIKDEEVRYNFPEDYPMLVPYGNLKSPDADPYYISFESPYTSTPVSGMNPEKLAFLPVMADAGDVRVCITESDLRDYPGLFVHNTDGCRSLTGNFARCPRKVRQGGHNRLQMEVTEREDYIARVDEARSFPWRIAVIGSDAQIAQSDLSYLLAEPSRIEDCSWIRPGKVAWDWWNDWNIKGVPFHAGINNDTYKYYIDFASAKGIEYVILDEGWAVNKQADLMQVVPEINLEEIIEYGRQKNVGIILWAGYHAFNWDMENVCHHYSEMGVKGFKVDFMDRDDQEMTAFNHRAAQMAAKYRLVLDLHGTHKPAGIHRTWPNVLNCEGVFGLEQMKWDQDADQMTYDVQIPFIRQVAGPMDYTQGAMHNATRKNYRAVNSEPMSQGTRCHQLALYLVLDSPVNMLCDSPSNYMAEPECTDFIAGVPTVWDETRILSGKVGEYIITARRKGETWYVGGITGWTARDLEVNLEGLGLRPGAALTLFTDGINADRKATDYCRTESHIQSAPVTVHLAPGGGFVMKIE